MKVYEPWDYCRSINCNALVRPKELRKQTVCVNCEAYKMHQYLKENNQILETGSELAKVVEENAGLRADNAVLKKALVNLLISHQKTRMRLDVNFEDQIATEEYTENLIAESNPGDALLKELKQLRGDVVELREENASLQGCFEEEEADHKELEALRAVRDAAEEYLEADGSITAQRLYDVLAAAKGVD